MTWKSLAHIGSLIKSNLIHRIPSELEGIPYNDSKKLPKYLCTQIAKYSTYPTDVWDLIEKLAAMDYKYAQGLLYGLNKNNYKNYPRLFIRTFGYQFKKIFDAYCEQNAKIADIIFLMRNFDIFFDHSYFKGIAERSKEFAAPSQYLLTIKLTRLSFNEASNFLIKEETLCAYFTLAYICLLNKFRNQMNWAYISKKEVIDIALKLQSHGNSGKKVAYMILDEWNPDAESDPLAETIYDYDFEKFKEYFQKVPDQGKKNPKLDKSNSIWAIPTTTKQEKGIIENLSQHIESGTILRILAFKNEKVALTEGFMDYYGGILYPQNILYKGHPVSNNEACRIIKLYKRYGVKTGFGIQRSINVDEKKYAILFKDFADFITQKDKELFQSLKEGDKVDFKIVTKTPHLYKVRVANSSLEGYVSFDDYNKQSNESGNAFKLTIAAKPTNEKAPIIFGSPIPHALKCNKDKASSIDEGLNKLFNAIELQNLDTKDKNVIEILLTDYPELVSKDDIETIDHEIKCRFREDMVDSKEYLKEIQEYLNNQNFWISPRMYNGEDHLIVFNQEKKVLDIIREKNTFYLTKRMENANNSYQAQKTIEANKLTKMKIEGKNIKLYGTYDYIENDYDAESTYLLIDRLNTFFKIKYDLQKKVHSALYQSAQDFVNQSDYLKYQIDQENQRRNYKKTFEKNCLTPISGEVQGESVAIRIKMTENDYNFLSGEGDSEDSTRNEIRINTFDNAGKIIDHCILKINVEGEYILHFIGSHKNIDDYLQNGINLQGDANVKHLNIQVDAIKEFTLDEQSLFRDLLGGNIEIPDTSILNEFNFFNSNFNAVENNNNQPMAVKKAMALPKNGILLIQGPPGTGKTTTIVEIIRQLIKEKKKVLVCSQSHAAVGNIFKKLNNVGCDNILRIDDDNETIDTKNFNSHDYEMFLKNNLTLMDRLKAGKAKESDLLEGFCYSNEFIYQQYINLHKKIIQYYGENNSLDTPIVRKTLRELEKEAESISGSLLASQVYQSKSVILGTCIGVGMNFVLKNKTIHFDTVIIDEAAKANLAETIVPMQMGERFILVGDDNQLPPYVDQEEIETMLTDAKYKEKKEVTKEEMVASQNKSLFEYLHYHRHPLFPKENLVTLNYQYRMNPAIGDFISELFYDGKIKNGKGTEKQVVDIQEYPNPVTVIDTSNMKFNYEQRFNRSRRNKCEANYIKNEILPKIEPVLVNNPDLTLGIISPYASQCEYIKSLISDKKIRESVHTIDSIQGMEFDIVIFSFVRSFSPNIDQKVGFVDDMKRLNVSLSRAKKKLIIIGNMNTLTRDSAHYESVGEGVKPLDVFKKLANMPTKISLGKTQLDKFNSLEIEEGTIFDNCTWSKSTKACIKVSFTHKNENFTFQMRVSDRFMETKTTDETISLRYIGLGKDSKPYFGFSDIYEEVAYSANKVEFEGEVVSCNRNNIVIRIGENCFYTKINNENQSKPISLNMTYYFVKRQKNAVEIDWNKCYEHFIKTHHIGDKIEGQVISKIMLNDNLVLYFINCGIYTCGCVSWEYLEEGSVHTFVYSQFDNVKKRVNLKYFAKYDK